MEGWRWRQKNTHELCDFRLLESCSHRDHLWSKRRGQKTNGWNLKIRLFQEKEKHPPKPAIFRFQIKLQGCKWVNSQFISYEGNQSWTCTICTVNQCFRQGRNPPWILQEKQQQQCWKMTVWIWKEDIHIQKTKMPTFRSRGYKSILAAQGWLSPRKILKKTRVNLDSD